jgi:hypothetical protein
MKNWKCAVLAAVALLSAAYSPAQTAAHRPAIRGISHISVYSSDAAKTEHFYVHDLGGVKRETRRIPPASATTSAQSSLLKCCPCPLGILPSTGSITWPSTPPMRKG